MITVVFTGYKGGKLRFVLAEGDPEDGAEISIEGHLELSGGGEPVRGVLGGEPTPPDRVLSELQKADRKIALPDVAEVVDRVLGEKIEVKELCRRCLASDRVTVLKHGYRFGEVEVCGRCAREILEEELRFRVPGFSQTLLEKLERLLHELRDIDRVVEMVDPAFDPAEEEEKTRWEIVEAEDEEEHRLPLTELDIPEELRRVLERMGYQELTPVQTKCVERGLLEGRNLLVVSPTGSGKTLVAELAGLTEVLREGRKMVYLVPLVALANQKHREFMEKYGRPLGIGVRLQVGAARLKEFSGPERGPSPRDADIIVGTYEGFDLLLRTGAVDPDDIGVVVIDEVHTLADERGPRLDGLVCRLKTLTGAQLLGLSATVGNPEELAEYLDAEPIVHNRRPVPLEYHLVINQDRRQKWDRIARLVESEWETEYSTGYRGQTIVFTYSRRNTHRLADLLNERTGLDVAPYHAGLPYDRRRSIERAFERGELAAVVTTAALGAGVDFPASQVIFESLAMGIEWLTPREFQQMAGRAGRPGYHDRGKVVLMVEPGRRYHRSQSETEDKVAFTLLESEPEPVEVEYDDEDEREQVLAHLVSGAAKSPGELERVCDESLGFAGDPMRRVKELREMGFVKGLEPTEKGRVAARYFTGPRTVHELSARAGSDPLRAVASVRPFERFQLSPSIKRAVERVTRMSVPSRLDDALSVIHSERKEVIERLPPKEKQKLVSLMKELDCGCDAFPHCEHVSQRASELALKVRLEGKSVYAIPRILEGRYGITAYPIDIANWLEEVVRLLECAGEIAEEPEMAAAAEALADPWSER
ncbi:DUF5814 domain-containing protein [Methanopyrus kandleri]|uniref:Archaea-specific Superfamily II helicase n=2 Tax=Methanopyrus kandleri TaxID=2320 RepID=Q8TGZ1_METKA|nr:DUF5814 domain-containing protein [Methanopyrus kandleri]AAM02048.1 Archaea-specific Superfamily II helicase [Methanopyrus kandleri AV19]HII69937.1 DEAD/DEAH box helicase [Methanopyrus kandleri]